MAKKRGGRPRKPGERYRSGDLRPTGEPLAPAAWQRQLQAARKLIIDPKFGCEIGRLEASKELNSVHVTAAHKVGEIYGRYERFSGKRRSTKSPSYQSGQGSSGADDDRLTQEQRDTLAEIEGAAFRSFQALSGEMQKFPRSLRDMVEQLCVDDRAVNPTRLSDLRSALDTLARFFGTTTSAKRAPHAHRSLTRAVRSTAKPAKPRVDLDRQAFITVARAMRPDLSDQELSQAHEFTRAIKARAIVRRGKENREARR